MVSNTKQVIGENVRRIRNGLKKSVEESALAAGVARGYWYEVERGITNPTVELLDSIAKALGVETAELLAEPMTVLSQDAVPNDKSKSSKRRKAS